MSKNKKRTFIYALVVFMVISATGVTVSAMGDKCKNVKITIDNRLEQKIKVYKVQYYDYDVDKWRKEMTWITLRIAPMTARSRIRHLEHVKDDITNIRIYVKKNVGGTSWREISPIITDQFRCRKNCEVLVTVR